MSFDFVISSHDNFDDAVQFCTDNLMTGVDIVEAFGAFHVVDVEIAPAGYAG